MIRFLLTFFTLALALALAVIVNTAIASTYTGSAGCQSCHQEEYRQWQTSHHAKSMQSASNSTVDANFSNTRFTDNGTDFFFYQKDHRFRVDIKTGTAAPASYNIPYTFGIYPLQQYLIELDDGRLQALTIAWDNRHKNQGGQHWFSIYAPANTRQQPLLQSLSPLHNWNSRCASCHSTNLQKNYAPATNTYNTSWSEINVACEACHGPAADHQRWLDKPNLLLHNKGFSRSLQSTAVWQKKTGEAIAHNLKVGNTNLQTDVCASCHSRRAEMTTTHYNGNFSDHFQSAYITQESFHADGQIKDEVFEYDSFLQSRMYRQGVTCSDCHNPHSAKLKTSGNDLCSQCHEPQVFDHPQHHHHPEQSTGAQCVNCHMPAQVYMGIDKRHDHSFSIPRPSISTAVAAPDACTQCHTNKKAEWSQQQLLRWPNQRRHNEHPFALAFFSAWQSDAAAQQDLFNIIGNINTAPVIKASALQALTNYPNPPSINTALEQLSAKEAMLRVGALRALQNLPVEQRANLFALVNDSSKAVRMELAPLLAAIPDSAIPARWQDATRKLFAEYIAMQALHSDLPEQQEQLGNFYSSRDNVAAAEKAYLQSLKLLPGYLPAMVNLASLYAGSGQTDKARQLLQQATRLHTTVAAPFYALGLLYVQQNALQQALPLLATSMQLEPEQSQYAYAYAAALFKKGETGKAARVVEEGLAIHPDNTELIKAAIFYYHELQDSGKETLYRNKLQR